jgi:uncharacterized protein YjbI with pentapeptide repeats
MTTISNLPNHVQRVAAIILSLVACVAAHGDIYQWEYVNPADPSQGKRQSTTLAPDGAGVDAESGAALDHRNLTMAYLIGADLTGAHGNSAILANGDLSQANLANANFGGASLTSANFDQANFTEANFESAGLTGANFERANLTNANFEGATLTDAHFAGAEIRGANFPKSRDYRELFGTGLTSAQLVSTASYQAHDLRGINFAYNNLAGVNFADQNLTNTFFSGATLSGANFARQDLSNVDFGDADLTGATFRQANLTNARFVTTAAPCHDICYSPNPAAGYVFAVLANADFTDADIRGASVGTLSVAQLYSTASYQAHDLSGIDFAYSNLAGVDLTRQNLTNTHFNGATLSGANFAGENLSNADFGGATLSDADFTGAQIRGASFGIIFRLGIPDITGESIQFGTGITPAQLYSTASYQAHDLSGIDFAYNDLTGVDLTGQNLTNSHFYGATLSGTNFTNADVRGASFGSFLIRMYSSVPFQTIGGIAVEQLYSTANYKAHDLSGIDLSSTRLVGGRFAGQNLSNVSFANSDVTGADFTGADVRGANFYRDTEISDSCRGGGGICIPPGSGIVLPQLYSTASYQAHELSGIGLSGNNLSGANFAGQNLTNASFYSATLTGADLNGADTRGAYLYPIPADAITINLIRPNGHIDGLDLPANAVLVVRNYDGQLGNGTTSPPIAITVDQQLAMETGGTLRIVFEADAWDSTISFAPGIPIALGGTLELTFADDVNLSSQVGRTFDLFDWTGVSPTGVFAVYSPYRWNLSKLYTTGEVTLAAVPEPSTLLLLSFAAFVSMRRIVVSSPSRVLPFAAMMLLLVGPASAMRADIFQWEFINPANPSQGKRQSTVFCPDGAGVDAVPGANLVLRNLTMASLNSANLTNARGDGTNLINADLSHANLTNASFFGAALTGADFTGAEVRGASFGLDYGLYGTGSGGTGITLPQLYSTASYQADDLSGVGLRGNYLAGGDFAGKNLSKASFQGAVLTDADFTDADIHGAFFSQDIYFALSGAIYHFGTGITPLQLSSTATYKAKDLSGIRLSYNSLTRANFTNQKLTNADFSYATLTDADFTGAEVLGANFSTDSYDAGTGITLAQLYSTGSYQAHDLRGIDVGGNDLSGGNFAGQNLTNASFWNATLTGANLTATDARGASGLNASAAIITNQISMEGHIDGLMLDAGGLLAVRNYHGDSKRSMEPIPVTVDQRLAMGPGGTLRMVFEADEWDSTISFAPGIPVARGGTLELTFADNVNLAAQVGRTFHLFNWTGVHPAGVFAVSSPYRWNLSNLYTTGEVTLAAVPEPTSCAIAIAGVFGMTFHRKRRFP